MKIKNIISRHRRDFVAIYLCEHCGHEKKAAGYDDAYFHKKVIPAMACTECGKSAPSDYKARSAKYPSGMQL